MRDDAPDRALPRRAGVYWEAQHYGRDAAMAFGSSDGDETLEIYRRTTGELRAALVAMKRR